LGGAKIELLEVDLNGSFTILGRVCTSRHGSSARDIGSDFIVRVIAVDMLSKGHRGKDWCQLAVEGRPQPIPTWPDMILSIEEKTIEVFGRKSPVSVTVT